MYAHLHMLLLEQHIVRALVSAEFARAADRLLEMTGLHERFPMLMRQFVPHTQLLQGVRRLHASALRRVKT